MSHPLMVEIPRSELPAQLSRRFEAVMFDWDGTAVPDRSADAEPVRRRIEDLCSLGLDVMVVSGTHVGNVDGQLQARPTGPGRLHLCLNRGSEVFRVDAEGVRVVFRRQASAEEDAALSEAARLTVRRLAERGLRAEIVSERLNRRKIDLIPEPKWTDPPKARIDELVTAVEGRLREGGLGSLQEAVEVAESVAAEAGLPAARVTSDAKHVEIGLTDKSDSARWAVAELLRRGIGPGLVLIVGDEMGPLGGLAGSDSLLLVPELARAIAVSVGVEPTGVPPGVIELHGGPPTFLRLLDDQIERRRSREIPRLDEDPLWTLSVDGYDTQMERVHESLLTLADGMIGSSGSPLGSAPGVTPEVLASGVYDGDRPETRLLPCPLWDRLPFSLGPGVDLRRVLDLRTGLLMEEMVTGEGPVRALRFSSLARPGTVALRAEGPASVIAGGEPLVAPTDLQPCTAETGGNVRHRWTWVRSRGASVGAAAADAGIAGPGSTLRLDRLGAYQLDGFGKSRPLKALRSLRAAEEAGFDRLLAEHRRAWASRWDGANVIIEGDLELQRAIRFALFHLMASVADSGEAAVGARGLSGPAYQGHVFWDSDVFVLPFLAATYPAAARAMLEYRIRRLPAAMAAARAIGRRGARFPWESASSGNDVTPTSARDRTGRIVPIRTGQLEDHIVADVAWAAAQYLQWTGDQEFRTGPGRDLLVETARYWASRVRFDVEGRAHIYGVIGPDEYHEPVDDDAYTNVMARWNLRRAAEVTAESPGDGGEFERLRWIETADALVDGYDPRTGVYEQCAGFFGLEPLIIQDVARRPIAADLLLGRKGIQGAQVVKQADVLMLHHVVPEEVAPGSLEPNLGFYEPRTAHGSSLSPGIHAALFARAGRLDEAVEALRLAARIDLDDLTGTSAGGLHLAAMGSVWQALAFGFAGLKPEGETLRIDPRLPDGWDAMEIVVSFHGTRIRTRVEGRGVRVQADGPVGVRVGEHPPMKAGPEPSSFPLTETIGKVK